MGALFGPMFARTHGYSQPSLCSLGTGRDGALLRICWTVLAGSTAGTLRYHHDQCNNNHINDYRNAVVRAISCLQLRFPPGCMSMIRKSLSTSRRAKEDHT
eukprot:1102998-Amphidinium_carterae.1